MRYPRIIAICPGPRTPAVIAAIHLVAAISFVHLFPVGPGSALAGSALLLASHGLAVWRLRRDRVGGIELGDDGLLRFPGSPGVEGRPCGRLADFGVLRWLEWRELTSGRQRACMVWRTECSREDWQALGIWLRHKAEVVPTRAISDAA